MDTRYTGPSLFNAPSLHELKLYALGFLNRRDLAAVGITCREMRTLSLDKSVNPFGYTVSPKNWKSFVERDSIPLLNPSPESQFAITSDNKLLMSNSLDFRTTLPVIVIKDLSRPFFDNTVRTLTSHSGRITSVVELSPGLLASCSMNGSIRIWDLSRAPGDECVRRIDIPHYYDIQEILNNGMRQHRGVLVRDPATVLIPFADNKLISRTDHGEIIMWDLSDLSLTDMPHRTLADNACLITKLSDTKFAYSDANGRIYIEDIQPNVDSTIFHFNPVQGPNLSMLISLPNQHLVTVNANSSTVKIWHLDANNYINCIFKISAQDLDNKKITALGYIPCGKIITAVDDELIIWDLTSKKRQLFSHFFTPNRLASLENDSIGSIRYHTAYGIPYAKEKITTYSEIHFIATLDDGRFLTISKDHKLHLYSYAPKPEIKNETRNHRIVPS